MQSATTPGGNLNMFRTIIRSALVVSIAAGGTLVLTALPASAKTIITAGAGSSASCTTQASAKLAPALKNDWTAVPGDSVPAVAAFNINFSFIYEHD